MTEAEMIILVRQALQTLRDLGQDNSDIVIEYRRGEPRNVRCDIQIKPPHRNDVV